MPGMYLKFMYFFLVFTQSLKPYTFFLPWSLFLYRKPSNFHRILPGPWPFESPTHPPWSQGFAPEKSTIISDVFLKKSTVFGAIGVPWTWKNKTGVRYIIYTLEVVATVKKGSEMGWWFSALFKIWWNSWFPTYKTWWNWLDFQGIYSSFLTLEILQSKL